MRRRRSPTASARSASARQATARDSADPCRRPVGGGGQVLVRHRGPAQGQGDSADGQLRQRLMGRGEMGQRPGAAPGVPEQGGGRRTSLHAGAHLDQLGLRSPPAPTLPVEEPTRLGGPVQGRRGLAGGERGRGRGEQQLGPLGRPAMDPVQLLDRGIGLLHGVGGQSRRGERGAPVDAQVGFGGAEPLESLRRLIEAAERVRQVAEPEGDQTAVHGDFHGLQFLAVLGEQLLGAPEVGGGTPRRTRREVADRPFLQRPGFPELVIGRSHGHDRGVQVLERLVVPPEDQQGGAAPEHHPGVQMPGGLLHRRIEGVTAGHAPPGEDESDPERAEHVRLALVRAGAPGQLAGDPQLDQGRVDVPVLPQHGADGLPRDRGGQGAGIAREHPAGPLQGLVGAGQRQRKKVYGPVAGQFGRDGHIYRSLAKTGKRASKFRAGQICP